jgi:hypothetical protein
MRLREFVPALIAGVFVIAAPARANTYTVVLDASASWSQAQTAAAGAGGYLATITSAAEQAAVNAAIAAAAPPQSGGFWINLRETTECCYIWDNGEASCYANFYPLEPNNGAPGETRGQIMWSLTTPSRRGVWNDVPAAGIAGTFDYSRRGYVIEFGPPDTTGGPCGACVRVNPASSCNSPPGGATVVTTQVTGVSDADPPLKLAVVRAIQRTIIDAEPPPGPSRARPRNTLATHTVTVPVPGVGVSAGTIVSAFIDSINRAAGSSGFVANYMSLTDSTVLRMYRVGGYSSSDVNTVPGITVAPYSPPPPPPSGGVQGPMIAWPGQALLALMLSGFAARALRRRRGGGA